MSELSIRPAAAQDIPALDRLLYQVHRVHSSARPDLFRAGAKKYTDDELAAILADTEHTPVFVAVREDAVVGYVFCQMQQHPQSRSLTDIRTLYIDDLCVDETARGGHIGTQLYRFTLDYARRRGCYNVTLNVWAGNDGALHFYEAIGMRVQKTGMETIL